MDDGNFGELVNTYGHSGINMFQLGEWLSAGVDDSSSFPFELWQVREIASQTKVIDSRIASQIEFSLGDPDYLEKATEYLGWGEVEDLKRMYLPTASRMQKGVFGESLAIGLLQEFHDLTEPVRKLRFRLGSNDSPRATDILVIRCKPNGPILEVSYVECKLKTERTRVSQLAKTAHDQLANDCKPKVPWILDFVARRLYEQNDPLFSTIMSYMRDRSSAKVDTYRVFLIVDTDLWQQIDMERLIEIEDRLDPLSVHLVGIAGLNDCVSRVYGALGLEADEEDD